MNKRGDELLSIWWFVILAIVGTGIVIGVLTFYSADVDVKGVEALILVQKAESCIVNHGTVSSDFVAGNYNFVSNCHLSQTTFKNGLLIKTILTDENGKEVASSLIGDGSLEGDCNAIGNGVTAENYPKCAMESIAIAYAKDGLILRGNLKILGASNQFGKREMANG